MIRRAVAVIMLFCAVMQVTSCGDSFSPANGTLLLDWEEYPCPHSPYVAANGYTYGVDCDAFDWDDGGTGTEMLADIISSLDGGENGDCWAIINKLEAMANGEGGYIYFFFENGSDPRADDLKGIHNEDTVNSIGLSYWGIVNYNNFVKSIWHEGAHAIGYTSDDDADYLMNECSGIPQN